MAWGGDSGLPLGAPVVCVGGGGCTGSVLPLGAPVVCVVVSVGGDGGGW